MPSHNAIRRHHQQGTALHNRIAVNREQTKGEDQDVQPKRAQSPAANLASFRKNARESIRLGLARLAVVEK